ncbi:MAG TPA: phospho-N-acetylmuramoyl-pentapeptide-transferase [Planctomycetaceae bacterium]|nr:phospho-N-acetylmuramoyl-pentapeptide-transferase [Planctomycetaceae bacterium]
MLVFLLERFAPLLERMEVWSTGDSRVFLTARTALASMTAFLLAITLGPWAIRLLKSRFRERIASDSEKLNELHAAKNATPTMGGAFILAAIVLAVLLWGNLSNCYVQLGLIVALGFGGLGAVDDYVKLSTKRNGLRAKQKLAVQVVLSIVIASILYLHHQRTADGLKLFWPLGGGSVFLGTGFILWSVLVLVGSSNAVNLTDGLDGLASGCMVFAGSAFVALTYLAGHRVMAEYLSVPHMPGVGELSIVLGATVGAVLGFLWFNCYPAEVFMGDTGSLPLGGLIGLAGLATRQEFLLLIVGGVFVIETLSVIGQVGWYRWTGTRLIACSPLHNHYLFKGRHEMKIVVRFWIGSALLAILAVASLKIR